MAPTVTRSILNPIEHLWVFGASCPGCASHKSPSTIQEDILSIWANISKFFYISSILKSLFRGAVFTCIGQNVVLKETLMGW